MSKMQEIIPIMVKATVGTVLCNLESDSPKYHVSLDVSDFNEVLFEPMCKASIQDNNLHVHFGNAVVDIREVCKSCLQYTEEVK